MDNQNDKPKLCYSLLESTSDGLTFEIIIIKYGDKGYYPTTYGRQTRAWVESMNKRIGVSMSVQLAYELCSMSGAWSRLDKVLAMVRTKIHN
jgi:hypothetical protein